MPGRPNARRLLACAALAWAGTLAAGASPSAALAADCNQRLFDGAGFEYDFETASTNPGANPPTLADVYGSLRDGGSGGPAGVPPSAVKTNDAWDEWGNVYVFQPGADLQHPTVADQYDGPPDACSLALGGQELGFPVVSMHGLEVQHRWYVDPGPLRGARVLTVLRNPGPAPLAVTVLQGDASTHGVLGSGNGTGSRATSDGSNVFSPASAWGVTTDGPATDEDPALAHVWDGAGGAMRVSQVVLGVAKRPEVLYWDWNLTVPAGGTSAFVSYEIEAAAPGRETAAEVAQAVEQAEARERQPLSSLYAGMSAAEIAATMNWPHPNPTTAIAPVARANAAAPVRLDGGGSAGAPGLPQCSPTYSWKADDGAAGSSAQLSHFFAPGRHTATLTVGNDCGGAPQSAKVSFRVASALKLLQVRPNRGIGTAALRLRALGPGRLTLSGKGVERQAKRVKAAGVYSLIVRPTGRALRSLARRAKATVKVTVTLRPPAGRPSKLTKTIVLRRVR